MFSFDYEQNLFTRGRNIRKNAAYRSRVCIVMRWKISFSLLNQTRVSNFLINDAFEFWPGRVNFALGLLVAGANEHVWLLSRCHYSRAIEPFKSILIVVALSAIIQRQKSIKIHSFFRFILFFTSRNTQRWFNKK